MSVNLVLVILMLSVLIMLAPLTAPVISDIQEMASLVIVRQHDITLRTGEGLFLNYRVLQRSHDDNIIIL